MLRKPARDDPGQRPNELGLGSFTIEPAPNARLAAATLSHPGTDKSEKHAAGDHRNSEADQGYPESYKIGHRTPPPSSHKCKS